MWETAVPAIVYCIWVAHAVHSLRGLQNFARYSRFANVSQLSAHRNSVRCKLATMGTQMVRTGTIWKAGPSIARYFLVLLLAWGVATPLCANSEWGIGVKCGCFLRFADGTSSNSNVSSCASARFSCASVGLQKGGLASCINTRQA